MRMVPKPSLLERRTAHDGSIVEVKTPARIVTALTARQVRKLVSWGELLHKHGEEDAAWDWPALIAEHHGDAKRRFENFGLVCRREIQAAMIVGWGTARSRVTRRPLVYVEYVATAPWNRSSVTDPPRF